MCGTADFYNFIRTVLVIIESKSSVQWSETAMVFKYCQNIIRVSTPYSLHFRFENKLYLHEANISKTKINLCCIVLKWPGHSKDIRSVIANNGVAN